MSFSRTGDGSELFRKINGNQKLINRTRFLAASLGLEGEVIAEKNTNELRAQQHIEAHAEEQQAEIRES